MHLNEICQARLSELAIVISQLNDQEYGIPLKTLNNVSLGAHTRHVIEFYNCLITQYPSGTVNYDLRERNPEIEQKVQTAVLEIEMIRNHLCSLSGDFTLTLNGEFELEGHAVNILTSLHRELVYQLEHTVHHMALLRVGLTLDYPHVTLPPGFGVAASTIRFRMAND